MTVVDWILLGILILFAVIGWYRGFVAGIFAFVGFIGGALVAAWLLPPVIAPFVGDGMWRAVAVSVAVLVLALIGQALATFVANRIKARITWQPARLADRLGGAALNIVALALMIWILASAVAVMPVSAVSSQVTGSKVISTLDRLMPPQVVSAFNGLRDFVGMTRIPDIYAGLALLDTTDVAAPDASSITSAVIAARESVLRVEGATPECGGRSMGTGFAISPDHVITNAHVVAGMDSVTVRVGDESFSKDAVVVLFDSKVDVAVLYVPGLAAPGIEIAQKAAETGQPAVIAGYPQGGELSLTPARVRARTVNRGEDIYGTAIVENDFYVLRADVMPGNSGGPLLRPDGKVIGMVVGSGKGENGYALTVEAIATAIDSGTGLTTPVANGSCRLRSPE